MTSATRDEAAFASALDDIRDVLGDEACDAQGAVDILFERFEPYSWVGIYVDSGDELILPDDRAFLERVAALLAPVVGPRGDG